MGSFELMDFRAAKPNPADWYTIVLASHRCMSSWPWAHIARAEQVQVICISFFLQCHRSNHGAHRDQTLWVDIYYVYARTCHFDQQCCGVQGARANEEQFYLQRMLQLCKILCSDTKLGTSMHLDEAFKTPCESLTWVVYNMWRACTSHLHLFLFFRDFMAN